MPVEEKTVSVAGHSRASQLLQTREQKRLLAGLAVCLACSAKKKAGQEVDPLNLPRSSSNF